MTKDNIEACKNNSLTCKARYARKSVFVSRNSSRASNSDLPAQAELPSDPHLEGCYPERVSFNPRRIGSVNCGQRPAIATTRTTRYGISHDGWSSRPRPGTRLQATSQPKSRESGRRVMRGGSKAHRLGSGQTKDRPVQGKLSLSPVKQSYQ